MNSNTINSPVTLGEKAKDFSDECSSCSTSIHLKDLPCNNTPILRHDRVNYSEERKKTMYLQLNEMLGEK